MRPPLTAAVSHSLGKNIYFLYVIFHSFISNLSHMSALLLKKYFKENLFSTQRDGHHHHISSDMHTIHRMMDSSGHYVVKGGRREEECWTISEFKSKYLFCKNEYINFFQFHIVMAPSSYVRSVEKFPHFFTRD